MFTCRNCLRRALKYAIRPSNQLIPTRETISRAFASISTQAQAVEYGEAETNRVSKEERSSLEDISHTPKQGRVRPEVRRSVRKELELMSDPFHIARHVEQRLSKGQFDEALLLAQKASSQLTRPCTVAWNHLIDYQMKQHRLRAAVKLFNDMKKRGQRPTPQTFTILFRGCALSPHRSLAVAEATRLFRSMTKETQAQPNIIHLNAVLHTCGRAGDVEAMFETLHTLEESKLKPKADTYTTIMQSLVAWAQNPELSPDLTQQQRDERKKQAVLWCKAVQDEVLRKWQDGSLALDEQLVSAMARALLYTTERPVDLLALLEKTLGMPRFDLDASASSSETSRASPKSPARKIKGTQHIKPGNRILAVLLDALSKERRVQLGLKYWQYLVNERGVVPDVHNWDSIFRLLQKGHSSSQAAQFIASAPKPALRPFAFRTALSTCLRDSANQKAPENAHSIVDVMLRNADKSQATDSKALGLYLQVVTKDFRDDVAANSAATWNQGVSQKRTQQVVDTLNKLWEPYCQASERASLPELVETRKLRLRNEAELKYLCDTVQLGRDLISVASKVLQLQSSIVTKKIQAALEDRQASMNRHVVVFTELRGQLEASVDRRTGSKGRHNQGAAGGETGDTTKKPI